MVNEPSVFELSRFDCIYIEPGLYDHKEPENTNYTVFKYIVFKYSSTLYSSTGRHFMVPHSRNTSCSEDKSVFFPFSNKREMVFFGGWGREAVVTLYQKL